MFFLNATDPTTIKLAKTVMIDWGYKRAAARVPRREGDAASRSAQTSASAADRRASAPVKAQVIHFINKPMPGGLPKRTSRALLDIEDADDRPDHPRSGEGQPTNRDAVFYFPGCGSERLFSQVGLATQAMLYHVGAQMRAAAGLPVLRLSADLRGQPRQGPADHHRQPRAVPPRRQHAQLPRHQDGDRVVRHVHGPAAEVRVRARSSPAAGCSTSTST